jgi:3-methyl-2-oxobutanoate hydroxymethyltransferase
MRMNKVRTLRIVKMKEKKQKIVMLTAYDCFMAKVLDEAGVDIILVGDSVGMVQLGFEDTLRVTLDMMIHHCAAVRRGVKSSLLVGDMPFMTYKINEDEALRNAARMVQEGGCEAVKIEGGENVARFTARIVNAGIPVMGHIGLIPQSVHQLGGYRVQGKEEEDVARLINDARALQEAGVFSIVVEAVPPSVGKRITESVHVPTIGIGAGPHCDGQVLVINDMLGLTDKNPPHFVKQYAELGNTARKAVEKYIEEVRNGAFPDKEHWYEE